MPFLRAGFNARSRDTGIRGWTRPVTGGKFAPAELRRFVAGDYFWLHHSEHPRFLAWGDLVVIGSWAFEVPTDWLEDLPKSSIAERGHAWDGKPIKFTIYGEPASKANSRELVLMNRLSKAKGRMVKMPALIKSEKAREYEHDAMLQIPPSARVRLEGPVRVTLHVYYATERPDLDESVVLDVMQDRYVKQGEGDKAERVLVQKGVYRNDRQVREKHVYWGKDAARPRAEIEVEPIIGQQADLIEEAA